MPDFVARAKSCRHERAAPVILLIGKNGQLGWELRRALQSVGRLIALDAPALNLCNADAIRDWVHRIQPLVIVNAAAYTDVDKAEQHSDLVHRVNAIAPRLLAEQAAEAGALMVHYSTDYVFDGRSDRPYREADPVNPLGVYGASKAAGDQGVAGSGADYLIFRTSWVYGARGCNFLLTMLKLARERETLRVVDDQIGVPTWSRTVAEVTASVLTWHLSAAEQVGGKHLLNRCYHLVSGGSTSWHGFARAIFTLASQRGDRLALRRLDAIATADYSTAAVRPQYSVLSTEQITNNYGLWLPDWHDALELVMDDLLGR